MKAAWETKELGAVSTISYGHTESASNEPVGPQFLRITDIQNGHVDWDSVPYCKIASQDLPKSRLASGDIVFARTGATTGKSFLVVDPPEAVFASYLIRLRLIEKKLLPKFLSFFFQTSSYWKSIEAGSTGSAQGGFNATKLGALSIRSLRFPNRSASWVSSTKRLTASPPPKPTPKRTSKTPALCSALRSEHLQDPTRIIGQAQHWKQLPPPRRDPSALDRLGASFFIASLWTTVSRCLE